MDRFEAMGILLAAIDNGSLSAASRKLRIPLATVSRRVSDLEAHLNVQLLVRAVATSCFATNGWLSTATPASSTHGLVITSVQAGTSSSKPSFVRRLSVLCLRRHFLCRLPHRESSSHAIHWRPET
jgi:hypothetical protein